jgi:CRISPR/Cas system-associated exonuclease Cas4 (RecB family)
MKTFLQECAAYLAEKYPELHRCCLILPSNRSLRMLRTELEKENAAQGWLRPEMCAVADWMERLSGRRLPTEEEIQLQLYQIHQELHPSDTLTFYQFAGHAKMMADDFNDIDLSLADAGNVFSSLQNIKELEAEFSDMDDTSPEMRQRYLLFCRELPVYYSRLQEKLAACGTAYQGLMYRIARERLGETIARLPYDKYIFIGFSALSVAEEEMVVDLYRAGKAEIIIDMEPAELQETERQEIPSLAGAFIRHLQSRIRPTIFQQDILHNTKKEIDIFGLPQESSQAELLPHILRKYRKEDQNASCVIVLLKEEMLLPVLYALPEEQANFSMEYRLKHTPVYALLQNYLIALENSERLSSSRKHPRLYHLDVRRFFSNPLLRERLLLTGDAPNFSDETILFLQKETLADILRKHRQDEGTVGELCGLFFNHEGDWSPIKGISGLLSLLQHERMSAQSRELLSYVQACMPLTNGLMENMNGMDITSVRYLLQNLLGRISIPFQSNPESRLQIMGMLETRALDFNHVIMLSVNEGVIPNARKARTLLPFDLRQHYRLPTFRNHEAIMTYHFYRLLRRAKRISLCYNMDNRHEIHEKSRLILQLQNGWEELPNIRISENIVPLPGNPKWETGPLTVERTEQLQLTMETHRYSPSSLNCFLECPLRFYLQQIRKVRPPEETDDSIGADTMGTVIHKLLEQRLQPGEAVPDSDFRTEEIVGAFCNPELTGRTLKPDDVVHEKNRLVLALCQRYLNSYLKRYREEIKKEAYTILHVEEKIEEFPLSARDRTIRFGGVIDREDRLPDGTHRIADYKTGHVDEKKLRVGDIQDLTDGSHKEALQLMLYMLVKHKRERIQRLAGEIISLQHPEQRMPLSIAGKTMFEAEDFKLFEETLSDLWERLLNPHNRFEPVKGDYCKYCDYLSFCSPETESD